MALVKMSSLLDNAKSKNIAVGSFSTYNMESIIANIKAAEDTNTSLIIQLAQGRFGTAPLELVGPMMVNAAKESKANIAVHLDHASDFEVIKRALELGFTSVMYDGSTLPFDENVSNTKKVVDLAKSFGADSEAELGLLGMSEGGEENYGIKCTDPADAEIFVKETNVSALAVAIGNQHGNYPCVPKLRMDILKDIHERIPDQMLVLHGGSGISDSDFQECIKYGIRKINIATATLNEMTAEAKNYLKNENNPNYYDLSKHMREGAYRVCKHHIEVFNMNDLSLIK